MTEITVTREDGPAGGRYLAAIEGHRAELTSPKAGALRGKGAGQAQIEKHAECQDVLA
jgi:hypothetical protein